MRLLMSVRRADDAERPVLPQPRRYHLLMLLKFKRLLKGIRSSFLMLSKLTGMEFALIRPNQQVSSRTHTTVFLCICMDIHQLLMVI